MRSLFERFGAKPFSPKSDAADPDLSETGLNDQPGSRLDAVERRAWIEGLLILPLLLAGYFLVWKLGGSGLVIIFGLLFTGAGLLMLSLPFSAKSPLHFLLLAPVALLFSYGWISCIFPASLAEYVVPSSWEWPVEPGSPVLGLRDGKTAVALGGMGAPRVQIYDAEGRYMGGWFVHSYGGRLELVEPEVGKGDSQSEETVLVHVVKDHKVIQYTLAGEKIGAWPASETLSISSERSTLAAYPICWYKLPLASGVFAGITAFIGMLGVGFLHLAGVWGRD
jgi:hypothetical protein